MAEQRAPGEPDTPSQTLPPAVSTAVRVMLTIAALAFVFSRIPISAAIASVRSIDPLWTVGAFAAVFAAILLSALKWSVLLKARGHNVSLSRLTRHYFVGLFFNNFLPTSVGGDVVRAWDIGKDIDDPAEGAASVIAERLIASFALGVTAGVGLAFAKSGMQAIVPVAVLLVVTSGLAGAFLVPTLATRLAQNAMGGRFERVAGWTSRAVRAVSEMLRNGRVAGLVVLLSIAFQVLVATVNYCLFAALGHPIGLGDCIVYTSIISAVTMVPITISGHGVREAAYAIFFGMAGAPTAVAVAVSVLFFVTVALSTLPGAAFVISGRRRVSCPEPT